MHTLTFDYAALEGFRAERIEIEPGSGLTLTRQPPQALVNTTTVEPARPVAGRPFTVRITVRNRGVRASGAVRPDAIVPSGLRLRRKIAPLPSIAPGGGARAEVELIATRPGRQRFETLLRSAVGETLSARFVVSAADCSRRVIPVARRASIIPRMDRAREEAAAVVGRIGRLPGFPLLLGAIVLCLLAGALLPAGAATAVGLLAPALLLLHACCRPTRRGDYAYAVIAPACVSALLHDLLGVPRLAVALPVAVLSLAAAWRFDAERRASRGGERTAGLVRRLRLAR